MQGRYRYLIIIAAILLHACACAQPIFQYNINTDNGLLNNHVYYSYVDRYGYLWMGCKKGVVRYNGYETKVYTLADGLATDDVWNFHEDKKGRLWLYGGSNEMGYIYKGKYKKVWIGKLHMPATLTPRNMHDTKDGVIFLNSYRNEKQEHAVCIEKNDSVRSYYTPTSRPYCRILGMGYDGTPYLHNNKTLYKIDKNNPKGPMIKVGIDKRNYSFFDTLFGWSYSICNYQVNVHNGNTIHALHFRSLEGKTIPLYTNPSERFITPYDRGDYIWFTTNKAIYKYDSGFNHIYTYKDEDLIQNIDSGDYVLNMCEDKLWNNCLSVPGKGAYINYNTNHFEKIKSPILTGYCYAGNSKTGIQYWYNNPQKVLLAIYPNGALKTKRYDGISDVTLISPYSNKESILAHTNGLCFIDDVTMNMVGFYKRFKFVQAFHLNDAGKLHDSAFGPTTSAFATRKMNNVAMLTMNEKEIYSIGRGVGNVKFEFRRDTVRQTTFSTYVLPKIVYDSAYHSMWFYNNNSIKIYDVLNSKNTLHTNITADMLQLLGIGKIENILIDAKYGNVYIKDHKKLMLYNKRNNSLKTILSDCKITDAHLFLSNNMLIAVGKFGVLFSKIEGVSKMSAPMIYSNTKCINYKNIDADKIQVSKHSLLLNTDKGLYSVHMPADTEWVKYVSPQPNYNLLLNYNDTTRILHRADTINISQNNYNIQFELVNPSGYGAQRYKYYIHGIDTAWNILNANELNATALKPDVYYDMSLVVSDDLWQSKTLHYKLYIIPHWWQTYYGLRIVWLSVVLIAAFLVWLIVATTKRVVNRNNKAKTMQLELRNLKMAVELKSIYSQINPHFIFNTLSTGLYYIKKKKMDEAYNHISSFSNLLRAYIKSSRNKYITLAEEIENLGNYISLQQSRFENKFDSEIIVANNVNPIKSTIPSLLLQPLVENAINHGLFHKEDKGKLKIEFKQGNDESELICIIDDDGVGRDRAKLFKEEATIQTPSYGTDLVKELINIFNTNEPIRIDIEYIDKQEPETGTTVILTIKNLNNDKHQI